MLRLSPRRNLSICMHTAPSVSICRRCGRAVASTDYETLERMHYVCIHYEFEHGDTDIDEECSAGGCPSRRVGLAQTLKDWAEILPPSALDEL
jgi:hypothetical protein